MGKEGKDKEEDNEDDENNKDDDKDDEESPKRNKMSEEKHVVIKITPRVLERTIYIIIIIILLAVIVIQNVSSIQFGGGNTETTTTLQEETTTTEASGGDGDETTTNSTTSTTTTLSESQIASDDELKGKVEISFPTNPEISDSGKVTNIEFKISNEGPSFYPQVKIFFYDDSDTAVIKSKEVAVWPTGTPVQLNNGVTRTYNFNSFTRSYVSNENEEETFVLKLYNRKTGTELDSATKEITVS
ncbi:MAG: hypothetical protein ABII01_00895 [Candidatus Woesearchaeota archaeon]